jgi:hypothetical protein
MRSCGSIRERLPGSQNVDLPGCAGGRWRWRLLASRRSGNGSRHVESHPSLIAGHADCPLSLVYPVLDGRGVGLSAGGQVRAANARRLSG